MGKRMKFQSRLTIMGMLMILVFVAYAIAMYYSPQLVGYSVEQTLMQKSPDGTDPTHIRERLRSLLASSQSREAKLERLLTLSSYLEKVQRLTPAELEQFLGSRF